ncbi:hypothetical protein GCM10009780_29750 [Actinomadura alba]
MAVQERKLLALLDGAATVETRGWLEVLRSATSAPHAMQRAYEIYARMDELADAAVDDPRVGAVAQAIADTIPDDMVQAMALGSEHAPPVHEEGGAFAEAFFADFAPAQAQAIREAMRLLYERTR